MDQTITTRPSTIEDLAEIDALLRRSYPSLLKADYPPSIMVLAVPLISRAKPRLISSGTYYVAEDESGALLGVGGWTRSPRAAHIADVRHVATDPKALRRGVGRAILMRIFGESARAGMRRLNCLSTRTAVPFYAAQGFQPLGTTEIPLAESISFPAVQMEKRL